MSELQINKHDVITQLYGLRAGMSAINEQKDGCTAAESACKKKVGALSGKISESRDAIERAKGTAQKEEEALKNERGEYYSNKKYIENTKPAVIRLKMFFDCFLILINIVSLPISLIAAIYYLCSGEISDADDFGNMAVWAFYMFGEHVDDLRLYKSNVAAVEKYEKKRGAEISSELDTNKRKLNNAVGNINKEIAEYKRGIEGAKKELNDSKAAYALVANGVYEIMVNEYGGLLDVRDWENVDLIIYLLETGRADNLKEALQQVDIERRNNQLINAIGEATGMICRTIQSGFKSMQSTMVTCFTTLSRQMQANFDAQSEQLAALGGSMAALKCSVDFGNALQAKANVTSKQLADDVQYMRGLAENAEIRRRSGAY